MSSRLKVLKGQHAGEAFELLTEFFVGRDDDNHLQVLDETASRHHARFHVDEGRVLVTDLGSNNGTFVNGVRVQDQVLKPGDRVLVGNTLLAYEEEGAAAPAEKATVLAETPAPRIASTCSLRGELPVPQDAARAVERLRRLYEVARALTALTEAPEIAARALDAVFDAVRAERAYVLALEPGQADPAPIAARQRSESGQAELALSRTLLSRAQEEGSAILVTDAQADPALGGAPSIVRFAVGSVICVPLVVGGVTLGFLYAEGPEGGFSHDDLEFVTGVGQQAALALSNARRLRACKDEIRELRRVTKAPADLVGRSVGFRDVLRLAERVADTPSTVLLQGETGTGKECLARFLHERSGRRERAFVALNCAALAESLLESELFGHERGAFTGATERRRGKFELADGGTLFLDEVGEMSPGLQAKLLRVLQERQFYTVGGARPVSVDVRIVAATNRDLAREAREGRFRQDLYFRIGVVTIALPALRERRDDIPQLAYQALARAARETKRPVKGISTPAMEALLRYGWPGNIRELMNVIERGVVLAEGATLDLADLPAEIRRAGAAAAAAGGAGAGPGAGAPGAAVPLAAAPAPAADGPVSIADAERECIARALIRTGGKKGEAAKLLGISWPTLNKKIVEYGL